MKNRARIIVEQGFVIYVGKSPQSDFHKHYALQIALVIDGKYKLYIEDNICEGHCFFLNSNVHHKHDSIDGIQISIFIDPETDLGNLLIANFSNDYHKFSAPPELIQQITEEIFENDSSISNIQLLIAQLFDLEPISRMTDVRVDSLIKKITSCDIETVKLESLMLDIPLSASRIRHLFKKQTGISIQRYILWSKIKNAFYHLMRNENLSQVAYLSGFSDYAHMSRTIKEMFGLNLKTILKDSHYVQDL